jgi:hypothetical protein
MFLFLESPPADFRKLPTEPQISKTENLPDVEGKDPLILSTPL